MSAAVSFAFDDQGSEALSPLVSPFLDLLRHERPAVRFGALCALFQFGFDTPIPLDPLLGILDDDGEDHEGRMLVLHMLASPRWASSEVVPHLTRVLGHPDPSLRRAAAESLGQMREAAASAVPALIERLGDKEYSGRDASVAALGALSAIAPSDPKVIAAFLSLIEGGESVRLEAIGALANAETGAAAAIPALERLLGDPDPEVRFSAALSLYWIDPANRSGVIDHLLAPCLRDLGAESPETVEAALERLEVLGTLATPAAPALLDLALHDPRDRISERAASMVSGMEGIDFSTIVSALRSDIPSLRRRAMDIVVNMLWSEGQFCDGRPPPDMLDALSRVVADVAEGLAKPDPSIQIDAMSTLERLGPAAHSALPALERASGDCRRSVRYFAREAIEAIAGEYPCAGSP